MKFQVLGQFVLLEIPYESRWSKSLNGNQDIKLEALRIHGIPLTIVSRGELVKESLQVGDKVLLFLDKGQGVNVIEINGIEYIFIQDFDLNVKVVKEEPELSNISVDTDGNITNN